MTGYGALLFGQLAVGSAALLARAGLDAGFHPLALSAWRLTIASAALLIYLTGAEALRRSGDGSGRSHFHASTVTRAQLLRLLTAGICLGLHFAAWFASLQRIPVARSTLLVATTPVWAGLAGTLVLRQRLPKAFWAGLVIAGAGAWLVTMRSGATAPAIPGQTALGDGLAAAGAITIAAYLLIVQPIQEEMGTLRLVAWTYALGAITLWPIALIAAGPGGTMPRSVPVWISAAGMALVPQLLGHTSMNWALRHFPSGVVGAATLLEPVIAAALAWWILAEPITGIQAVGALVLLLGVGLAIRRHRLPITARSHE